MLRKFTAALFAASMTIAPAFAETSVPPATPPVTQKSDATIKSDTTKMTRHAADHVKHVKHSYHAKHVRHLVHGSKHAKSIKHVKHVTPAKKIAKTPAAKPGAS